jgi:hypothetical protein
VTPIPNEGESTGSLLDSLLTLGYSDQGALFSSLLARCLGDLSEIISMVVFYWRTAHSLRVDGTGGCARPV